MKSNIKVKFNDRKLKQAISNNVANISCPNCGVKLEMPLNQSSTVCPFCKQIINYNATGLVNDIAKAFKDGFK